MEVFSSPQSSCNNAFSQNVLKNYAEIMASKVHDQTPKSAFQGTLARVNSRSIAWNSGWKQKMDDSKYFRSVDEPAPMRWNGARTPKSEPPENKIRRTGIQSPSLRPHRRTDWRKDHPFDPSWVSLPLKLSCRTREAFPERTLTSRRDRKTRAGMASSFYFALRRPARLGPSVFIRSFAPATGNLVLNRSQGAWSCWLWGPLTQLAAVTTTLRPC